MQKEYSITYDFGTGSVKAALINKDYEVLAWRSYPYPMYYPQLGFAVQKVDDLRRAFVDITNSLFSETGIKGEQIRGIVISQTSCTMIFVDKNLNCLSDIVAWCDNRGVRQAENINREISKPMWTQGKRIPAKMRWFLDNEPETVNNAEHLLDVSAYFYLLLTGQTAFDWTAAVAYDFAKPSFEEWDPETMDIVGMPHHLLPKRIIASYEKVGEMIPGFAEEAGYVAGTPIFGGCSDNANGHLGAGCIRPGDAHLYMGSSGWISVSVTMPENRNVRNVIQSSVPGIGYDYYCTNAVGTSIDHFISEFYKKESEDRDIEIYDLISKEALEVENDPQDILYLSYLLGEEEPVMDPAVRGTILNIKTNTRRAHIARALFEGIGFNYRWIKENLTEQNAWNINFLRAIGGGTQSDVHMQIIADIMDETLIRIKNTRVAGNVGLAACIDIGLGEANDFTVLDDYVKEDKVFIPRPEFKERYDRLFAIYKESYYALKGIYEKLNLEN